ncbi:MAG: maleylpyruvate isomerase family mycothiol-dependent enzyme [Propionibacteriales bacterium]|nr:maleylpyruvate isomerase family mycothiol-dependent enzyme [Propionibacteriales bacterium]
MNDSAMYVDVWRECARNLSALFADLGDDDWSKPTDCPGWTVHDIAAHLAALEAELAGDPLRPVEPPPMSGTLDPFRLHTELGVHARRQNSPEQLVAEFRGAVERRTAALEQAPPTDLQAPAGRTPGGIGWTWERLLQNRAIDLWVHEQDIRRASDRPGSLDSAGARFTVFAFGSSLPFVLGKKVQPEPGTTVVWQVTGPVEATFTVVIGDDGRGRPLPEPPSQPTARLAMDTETFVVLMAGRRPPEDLAIAVQGDETLARRVLGEMAVTS